MVETGAGQLNAGATGVKVTGDDGVPSEQQALLGQIEGHFAGRVAGCVDDMRPSWYVEYVAVFEGIRP